MTELSRWGRSTTDLLATLREREARRVSVIAMSGMIQDRIRSGIAAAKARGKRLGRQPGHRPKSDRLAGKVLALVQQGRSYRLVGREVGLSKNTVADIVKRGRKADQAPQHREEVPA